MNFFELNQLFAKRNRRLDKIALEQIRKGDFFPRSKKVLNDINLAIFENSVTDRELLARFGSQTPVI